MRKIMSETVVNNMYFIMLNIQIMCKLTSHVIFAIMFKTMFEIIPEAALHPSHLFSRQLCSDPAFAI